MLLGGQQPDSSFSERPWLQAPWLQGMIQRVKAGTQHPLLVGSLTPGSVRDPGSKE